MSELIVAGAKQVRTVAVARVGSADERGMVSAEWAVGIVAAIAIAGVLLAVVTDGAVSEAILQFLLWVIGTFTDIARGR